jgi:hypothetical protein
MGPFHSSPLQAHPQGSQNFMMQPHQHFAFNPVSSYSHMGLQSQQFTPNLSTLLAGQQPTQQNANNNFQFYQSMNF